MNDPKSGSIPDELGIQRDLMDYWLETDFYGCGMGFMEEAPLLIEEFLGPQPTTVEGRDLYQQAQQRLMEFAEHIFKTETIPGMADDLADVRRWRDLAEKDRKQYRTELDTLLRKLKRALDRECNIESHRPRNKTRGKIIWEIKKSEPHLSFGQVAKKFEKRTGTPITPNAVERSYKREQERIQARYRMWDKKLLSPSQDNSEPS